MPASRKRQSSSFTFEQAISLLQEAGFVITAPDLAERHAKKKAAPQALGFASRQPPPKVITSHVHRLHLTFAHSINGRSFGPGEVYVKSPDIASHLMNADKRAIEQENRVFDTTSRSYLIVERRTPGGLIGPVAMPLQGFELTHMDNVPLYGEYRA